MSDRVRWTYGRSSNGAPVHAQARQWVRAIIAIALLVASACRAGDPPDRIMRALSAPLDADSMGAKPTAVHAILMREPKDLVENSAAVMSQSQPGVFFTVNDSGNDPVLFALDTTGATRGRWTIQNATNTDWEAAARGPCLRPGPDRGRASASCLFLGDVGDNGAVRPAVTIYRVEEPAVTSTMAEGTLHGDKVVLRYPDSPHDVEAMYVSPDGTIYLLTKRPLKNGAGQLRNSLVFTVSPEAWDIT